MKQYACANKFESLSEKILFLAQFGLQYFTSWLSTKYFIRHKYKCNVFTLEIWLKVEIKHVLIRSKQSLIRNSDQFSDREFSNSYSFKVILRPFYLHIDAGSSQNFVIIILDSERSDKAIDFYKHVCFYLFYFYFLFLWLCHV